MAKIEKKTKRKDDPSIQADEPTSTPQGDEAQARDLAVFYDDLTEDFFKCYDHCFMPLDQRADGTPYGDLGTWARKGSVIYPAVQWDFGRTINGESFGSSAESRNHFVVFKYAPYEKTSGNVRYRAVLFLDRMTGAHAEGSRSSGDERNSGKEWYFNHTAASLDPSGVQEQYTLSDPHPGREHHLETSSTNSSAEIDYLYPPAYVGNNQGAGFITYGFEKDATPPHGFDEEEFVRNWCKFWLDMGMAFESKEFQDVIQDIIASIRCGILDNEDDPMNPCVNVFSEGFLRAVVEKQGGTFTFQRKVEGLRTELETIINPPTGYLSYSTDAQVLYNNTDRYYTLHYTLKVERLDNLPTQAGTAYSEENFQGESLPLLLGRHDQAELSRIGEVRSVSVDNDLAIATFSQPGFAGPASILTSSQASLSPSPKSLEARVDKRFTCERMALWNTYTANSMGFTGVSGLFPVGSGSSFAVREWTTVDGDYGCVSLYTFGGYLGIQGSSAYIYETPQLWLVRDAGVGSDVVNLIHVETGHALMERGANYVHGPFDPENPEQRWRFQKP